MESGPRHDKAAQLLRLALELGSRAEGMTLDEMADELELGRRTVERMKTALMSLFEVDAVLDGKQKRFRIAKGLGGALTSVSVDELAELALAAKTLRQAGAIARAEQLESLERKILSALRANDRRKLAPDVEALNQRQIPIAVAGPHRKINRDTMSAVQLSLKADCLLSFDYQRADGTKNHRTVAPRGLLLGATPYLVAHINDWGDAILWRLDRMQNLSVEAEPAWPAKDFKLEAYATQSFGAFQEEPESVVLVFDETAAEDVQQYHFHSSQEMSLLEDGRVEVRFAAGGMQELALNLIGWGNTVTVISPDRLREDFRSVAEQALINLD